MADPTMMLDAEARRLYEAWTVSLQAKRALWNPFRGEGVKAKDWDHLNNHEREEWRGEALRRLRSEETLADELRREERERRSLSVRETKGGGE